MKILMMVPVWRRPQVLRIFVDRLEASRPKYAALQPLFVLSPEDPDIKSVKRLTDGYSVLYTDNAPLGRKKNSGLDYALNYEWDYYMDMGSDDIWTDLLWQLYEPFFEGHVPYFGINNTYQYDYVNHTASFIPGWHRNIHNQDEVTALGVGRCVAREVIEKAHFAQDGRGYVGLWRDNWTSGMDGISDYKIQKHGYKAEVIDVQRMPVVCGVKTLTNLTLYMEAYKNEYNIDPEWICDKFGLPTRATHPELADFKEFSSTVEKLYQSSDMTKAEAFDTVNVRYGQTFGEKRYKNYKSYREMVRRWTTNTTY